MLRILVLGAGSFIGKHLVRQIAAKNDLSITLFGRHRIQEFNELDFIQGDFADLETLHRAVKNQDIVYHFISQTIPATSWQNPLIEIEGNLKPFLNFIEIAAQHKIKKICFASSGGTVYGLQQDLLKEANRTEPFSPYGIIKRTVENFLYYAKQKYQIEYDIYRISNVYGEGQNINKGLGFINTALEKIACNEPVLIYGDGNNVRDYIYVKDVAKLLTLSVEKNIKDSDIYNVSSNFPISLNELIKLTRQTLGFDFEVRYEQSRGSDNQRVILDNSKIMDNFEGFELTTLNEGIKKTYSYLKTQTRYVKKTIS